MKEKISSFYSTQQLKNLKEQGVIIPDLSSVKIGQEIPPENISPGCTLHPFVRSPTFGLLQK